MGVKRFKRGGMRRLRLNIGPQHLRANIGRTPVAGVGSSLLRSMAAKVWDEVTGGPVSSWPMARSWSRPNPPPRPAA
jgi:hypothetical protein